MEINLKKLTAKEGDLIIFFTEAMLMKANVLDTFEDGVMIGFQTPNGVFPWFIDQTEIVEVNPINSRPHLN